MKKQLLLLLGMLITISSVEAQVLLKNGINANIGMGLSNSSHKINTLSIGYQREVVQSLYLTLDYSDTQGSQSFKSLFGEVPQANQYGEFGQGFRLYDEGDNIFGRLIQIKSWSFGVKKYIQLGSKFYMAGNISVVSSGISEIDIQGMITNPNGEVDYSKARPVYGTYSKISGKVGFEALYNLKEVVNLVSKIEYLSLESIITLSIGTTVSF